MSSTYRMIFWLVLFCRVWGQEQDDVHSLYDAIFNRNSSNYINVTKTTEEPCICVQHYLCKSGPMGIGDDGTIDIRYDNSLCSDNMEVCCNKSDMVTEKIIPIAPTVKKVGCGHRNPEGVGFRILGKKDEANFGEIPWMAAILHEEIVNDKKSNVYMGGGSLIHPQVVLTGAQCVFERNQKLKVRVGDWDSGSAEELFPHQDRKVASITVHPQYDNVNLYNDIALLFLESPVEIAENVNVVCLPPQSMVANSTSCFASGWGKDLFGRKGRRQVVLKKIELSLVGRTDCQAALRNTRLSESFDLHRSFVCAGGEEGKDTCSGDGGSPLVCPIGGQTDRYSQTGIVAWGIGCGMKNVPGVYADVSSFRNWIDAQMVLKRLDTKSYQY